ncbi:MAG: hypothetical protein GEV06_27455 [Luteitalea sp.]|nr:hypothetical protein [Luteitalea sp.]
MSSRQSGEEHHRGEQKIGGASRAPERAPLAGEEDGLTSELGSEGGSQGELTQASRASREERVSLLPRLIGVAVLLLLGAVLLWLVVTMR